MRDAFVNTATELLDEDPRVAVVLADISRVLFEKTAALHPDRVINVGIREQLMVGVAGGLALTGLRPIVHSYATFAVDRAYEQLKLDLDHQGSGAIVVSVGASYDAPTAGRTHQSPGDVALFDTLKGWTVHVPGHADEVPPLLRAATAHDRPVYIRLSEQANTAPQLGPGSQWLAGLRRTQASAGTTPVTAGYNTGIRPRPARPQPTPEPRLAPTPIVNQALGGLISIRRGERATVLAVGPMLDPVLAATEGLDVTVLYVNTPRPLDARALRAAAGSTDLVLVEPYLAGTSAATVAGIFDAVPHRLLSLGIKDVDLRSYGSMADHAARQGLDPAGLRRSIAGFLS